jgi:GntR family transcriptional regulator
MAKSPRVAVINEVLAHKLFGKSDPIGRHFRLDSADGPELRIVGMANQGIYTYWAEPAQEAVWTPSSQDYSCLRFLLTDCTLYKYTVQCMAEGPQIRIDPASGVPAVRQITDGLRVLLVEGALAPGAELPSVRRLAMELGIHFNTVAEAYRQLAAEGWLDLKHGRGSIVVERVMPPSPDRDWTEDFRNRLRGMVAHMRSEGISAEGIAAELRAMAEVVTQS